MYLIKVVTFLSGMLSKHISMTAHMRGRKMQITKQVLQKDETVYTFL